MALRITHNLYEWRFTIVAFHKLASVHQYFFFWKYESEQLCTLKWREAISYWCASSVVLQFVILSNGDAHPGKECELIPERRSASRTELLWGPHTAQPDGQTQIKYPHCWINKEKNKTQNRQNKHLTHTVSYSRQEVKLQNHPGNNPTLSSIKFSNSEMVNTKNWNFKMCLY